MVINEEVKNQVQKVFKDIYAVKEQASDLNKSATDLKANLAKMLKVETTVVAKAYSEWEARVKKKDIMDQKDELLMQAFNQ